MADNSQAKKKTDYPAQKPGIIKKIEDKLEKVGDVIQEKIEAAGNFLESEWNKHNFGPALANFVTGAQIQLISKASGHSLHIVQDPSGELIVEGKGDIGPQAWNAIWTVFNDGNNQVHLYNYNNFLGIVDGETKVIHVEAGAEVPVEAKLQLVLSGELMVSLQSTVEHGRCIGINADGTLLSPKHCFASDEHSLFGILLFKTTGQQLLEQNKEEKKDQPMEQAEEKKDQPMEQAEEKK